MSPPFGFIRLGDHQGHAVSILQQSAQARNGEIRRPHEHDIHPVFSPVQYSSGPSIRITCCLKTIPSRWSFSWQMQRATKSSPVRVNHFP